MSILDSEELRRLIGDTPQPTQTSAEDYNKRFISSFANQLAAAPLSGAGYLLGGDNFLTHAGEALAEKIDAVAAPDPLYSGLTRDLASGAGSMLAFMTPGAAIGAGPKTAAAIAAGLGATGQAQSGYQDAKAQGADEETAISSARWNAPVGLAEGLPIGRVFGRAAPAADEIADGLLSTIFKETAKGAAEEAAQEGFTQLGSNVVAKDIVGYDEERGRFDDVAYNALLGALLGGPVSGGAAALGRSQQRGPELPGLPPPSAAPLDGDILPPDAPQTPGEAFQRSPNGLPTPPNGPIIEGEAATTAPPVTPSNAQQNQGANDEAQAAQRQESTISAAGQFDLNNPLPGEESVLITDPRTGEEAEGFYHEATNKVRRVGEQPHPSVLDVTPNADLGRQARNTEMPPAAAQQNNVSDGLFLPAPPQQKENNAPDTAQPNRNTVLDAPIALPDQSAPQSLPDALAGISPQAAATPAGPAQDAGAVPSPVDKAVSHETIPAEILGDPVDREYLKQRNAESGSAGGPTLVRRNPKSREEWQLVDAQGKQISTIETPQLTNDQIDRAFSGETYAKVRNAPASQSVPESEITDIDMTKRGRRGGPKGWAPGQKRPAANFLISRGGVNPKSQLGQDIRERGIRIPGLLNHAGGAMDNIPRSEVPFYEAAGDIDLNGYVGLDEWLEALEGEATGDAKRTTDELAAMQRDDAETRIADENAEFEAFVDEANRLAERDLVSYGATGLPPAVINHIQSIASENFRQLDADDVARMGIDAYLDDDPLAAAAFDHIEAKAIREELNAVAQIESRPVEDDIPFYGVSDEKGPQQGIRSSEQGTRSPDETSSRQGDGQDQNSQGALGGSGTQEAASQSVAEAGADGRAQTVIPGAERISEAEQAQRGADKRLQAGASQKPMDIGMFGADVGQADLVDMAKQPAKAEKSIASVGKQDGTAAKRIAKLLYSLGIDAEIMRGEDYHRRIENPPFMDLVIERLPHDDGSNRDMISFAHYIEQAGDLVNDGEMTWTVNDDGTLTLYDVIPAGMVRGQRPAQADHRFAAMFAKNLLDQGFGKVDLDQSAKSNTKSGADETPNTGREDTSIGDAFDAAVGELEKRTQAQTAKDTGKSSPTGIDYPNRKLNFRYARSDEDARHDTGAMANIALANMRKGDEIPPRAVGQFTRGAVVESVSEKTIVFTDKGTGKKVRINADSPKFEALSRDLGGFIGATQHGVDGGDVLQALKRDPAFSYDENQIPQLVDTDQEGGTNIKDGPNNSILRPLNPASSDLKDAFDGLSGLFESEAGFKAPQDFDESLYRKALPYLRKGVSASSGDSVAERMRSLVEYLASAGMPVEKIRKMRPYAVRFMQDVEAGKESLDVSRGTGNLESDSGQRAAGDGLGKADVPPSGGQDAAGARERGSEDRQGAEEPDAGSDVLETRTDAPRSGRDLVLPDPEPRTEPGNPTDFDAGRGRDAGEPGSLPDPTPAKDIVERSSRSNEVGERRKAQKAAEATPVKPGIENIRATLPMLHPGQQQDVLKVEQRFEKGAGMLLTNGTGTGKTYSGLGVMKRFAKQGKTNQLVVAPSQGILEAWVNSARDLGLKVNVLGSREESGADITATTYANLGQNETLADRQWDLVVADEAHTLSSNAQGDVTSALQAFRAITGHGHGYFRRAQMVERKTWNELQRIEALLENNPSSVDLSNKRNELWRKFQDKQKQHEAKWKTEERSKALLLSATPFAHHFSLDYAEGYIYDYPQVERSGAYNAPDSRDQFYIENLGYRKRYGKLTKPDANVDTGIMERQLHERFRKEGSLAGRVLEVERDYDRKFVLVHDAVGQDIDRAFKWLQEASDGRYSALGELYRKRFDYLSRARLLEAMKAKASVDYIQKNLDLGRKVIVFHNYNEGGGFTPFPLVDEATEVTVGSGADAQKVSLAQLYREFIDANPYVEKMDFSQYRAPMYELKSAFGDRAEIYNGTVSKKKRSEALEKFNAKDSGVDVLVIQSDAGSAGLSAHDVVGDTPRALLNLGLPTKPTAAIQQEGRIYRDGQMSDAMFRYLNTGTIWERMAFASTIAERASTAENLAMGDLARTLKQSFIDAYQDSDAYPPGHEGEGTGGKEADRAMRDALSEFERAKTHYFAQQKKTSRNKSAEGVDYFATPEPLGLKMVEWADIKPGEKVLEPSAGHGAIARYFPENTNRTIVEPSQELLSRAMLNVPGAKAVHSRFEDLNIVNKYDAIIMNPPFGHGGKTAVDHLDKAVQHLRNGGRVVALIPTGPAADKRFYDWYENVKDVTVVRNAKLPAVTFERAGTKVMSRVVVLEKQTDKDVGAPSESGRDYTNAENIGEFFDRIENSEVPPRAEPKSRELDIEETGEIRVADIEFKIEKAGEDGANAALKIKGFIGGRFAHVKDVAGRHGGEYAASAFVFPDIDSRAQFIRDLEQNPEPKADAAAVEDIKAVKFTEHDAYNKKRGKNVKVAQIDGRVPREQYTAILAVAKRHGGYYSTFKGAGAVPGFQFDSAEARKSFIDDVAAGNGLEENAAGFIEPQVGNQAAKDVLEAGRKDGNEHVIVVHDGKSLPMHSTGEKAHVGLTAEQEAIVADASNNAVVHHNHPSNRSFSPKDIAMLGAPGLAALYVHGHKGNWARAALTPKAKALFVRHGWRENVPKILRMVNNAYKPVFAALQAEITKSGNREFYDLSMQHDAHILMLALEKAGLIEYNHNFATDFIEHTVVVKAIEKAEKIAFNIIERESYFAPKTTDVANRSAEPARYPGDMGVVLEGGREPAGQRYVEKAVNPRGKTDDRGETQLQLLEEAPPLRSAAFSRWFGKSKVVDKSGKPLVVYHGTNADFDAFSTDKMGDATGAPSAEMGFFFAANPAVASSYADMTNPYNETDWIGKINRLTRGWYQKYNEAVLRWTGSESLLPDGANVMPTYLKIENPAVHDYGGKAYREKSFAEVIAEAKAAGRDGVIIKNAIDEGFNEKAGGDAVTDIYVAFEPTQIKSATGNRGTYDPDDANILRENEPSFARPNFYSQVARTVEGISQNKAQPDQWKAMIAKAPGVKPEEIEWLGINEWLDEQDGAVTKEAVTDFVRANQITVSESLLDTPSEADIEALLDDEMGADMSREEAIEYLENEEGAAKYATYTLPGGENYREMLLTLPVDRRHETELSDGIARFNRLMREKYGDNYFGSMTQSEREMYDAMESEMEKAEKRATNDAYKSSHWSEPNVVAHVRFSERTQLTPFTEEEKAGNAKRAAMMEEYNRLTEDLGRANRTRAIERDIQLEKLSEELRKKVRAGEIKAGEYDRLMNERMFGETAFESEALKAAQALDAKRTAFYRSMPAEIKQRQISVLHIEEIQSDWHQAGRKKGYRTDQSPVDQTLRDAAQAKAKTALAKADDLGFDRFGEAIAAIASTVRAGKDWTEMWDVADLSAGEIAEVNSYADMVLQLNKWEEAKSLGVPDAPFKTTWPELAFKRMLRWAAEHGFDRIVWTPGDVQADRYDLSKQVDYIGYRKNEDGTYYLSVQARGRPGQVLNDGKLTEQQLAEYVGKEVADKIVAGEGKIENWAGNNEPRNEFTVLKGLDLKVGGEGMRGFYDKMLPKTVNKMVKKWGGKVETSKVDIGNGFKDGSFAGKGAKQKEVWSLDLTDEMRDAAMDGMALFEESPQFERPATENWSVPHRGTFNLLLDGNIALMRRIRAGLSAQAMQTAFDKWRVGFQDRFLPMLRTEQAIERFTGEELPEGMKAYLAEELYSGRAGARLDRINRSYMEPISAVLLENGISQDEASEYLYARHAQERNERIANINPEMEDAGSGMTDAEAQEILDRVEADERAGAFQSIGRMVDRMLRESVRYRVEAGLLSPEMADAWQQYQHYVPLRGFEDIDEDTGLPNTGKGFSVRGPESRRALGRESRAGDILATAFSVAQEAVIRGEKNRVVQRLYDLAKAHPNKSVWEINPVTMRRVFNKATGLVYSRAEPIAARDAHNTVSVKFNGIEHRIVIHDKRLAEAVKRLNPEDMNGLLKFMIGFNRYLSTMNTTLNPEFVVSNALRDLQTAMVHLQLEDQDGLAKDVMKDYRGAMAGAWGGLRGKSVTTEWRKWYREFDQAGGKVSFFSMNDVADLKKKINRISTGMSATDPRKVWRAGKALFKVIEDMNLAVDNAVRLSLYKNLRERGVSKDQAASAAKNLTVNFNRRGQYATTMNAFYLFYNAGVQGTAILVNAMRHKKAQRLAAGMVGGGVALALLNALFLSDEDENGELEYDKVPDYVKSRNLVMMIPGARSDDGGQSYIKIPLPYGYNVFWGMGSGMADYARGANDGAEVMGALATTFVDSFNPLGGTESIAKLISPTILDPMVEIIENEDFAGRPIRPNRDKFNDNIPKSQDYYGSVTPTSRFIAKMLNDWTGGNDFKPGALDMSPEWIDHGAKFLGGAALSTWARPINTVSKLARGEEISSNDVPFVRRVHGRTGIWVDRNRFYNRMDEIEAAYYQVNGFKKARDKAGYDALDDATKRLAGLRNKGFLALKRNLRDLRRKRNEIYASPLSASERSARLRKLEDMEAKAHKALSRAYLRAVGQN